MREERRPTRPRRLIGLVGAAALGVLPACATSHRDSRPLESFLVQATETTDTGGQPDDPRAEPADAATEKDRWQFVLAPYMWKGDWGVTLDASYLSLSSVSGSVLRVDAQTGVATTISTGIPSSAIAIDRAPARDGSLLLVGDRGGLVRRIRRDGIETSTFGPVLGRIYGLSIARSRNVATVSAAPPNHRQVVLDFPGDAGKPYVCALSVSGYTGGPRLSDGRVIPLQVDDLTLLTASRSLAPLFTKNIGQLDATGRAVLTFNANSLGRAVQGVRVWMVALTIDGAAPVNVSAISAPVLVVL